MTINLGRDTAGTTSRSLEALQNLRDNVLADPVLKEVRIISLGSHQDIQAHFIFEGSGEYIASGFSIGYGGEGPHGLWKGIKLFYPDLPEFWETPISRMDARKSWIWTLQDSFQRLK
jgi:hypothetical protein